VKFIAIIYGPLPKLCPAVVLSRHDGRHSAVALLLKAALIQVSDYRQSWSEGGTTRHKFGSAVSEEKI
jgi:hypothetical protein